MKTLNRREAVKRLAAGAAVWRAPLSAQAQTKLPNIVFLISDDHSAADLGCYGNPAVATPNLDRLAGQGVRFDSAFVSSPQCSPNRSSILSGCAPHTIGTSRLHSPYPPHEPSIVEMLKQRGYYAGAYRKVHQGEVFDRRFDFRAGDQEPFPSFFDRRPADRPFYLHVGFHDPHRPYRKGAFSPPHDPARARVPDFLPDTAAVREDLALYYDEIARLDSQAGEILRILEKLGLAENTLVMFTGDNGMPFPRAKGTLYDSGIRVPLIARWPGRIRAGTVTRELVSSVDLPVTWLEMAGLARPAKMQGRSLLPLFERAENGFRETVFAERNWHNNFDPMRAVRTRRHKLIYNARPELPYRPIADLEASPSWASYLAESRSPAGALRPHHWQLLAPVRPLLELYDLQKDPGEFHNLATDPAHAALRRELEYRLSDWMHETQDFLPPLYSGYPASRNPGRRDGA